MEVGAIYGQWIAKRNINITGIQITSIQEPGPIARPFLSKVQLSCQCLGTFHKKISSLYTFTLYQGANCQYNTATSKAILQGIGYGIAPDTEKVHNTI